MPNALEISSLRASFGGLAALDGVEISIPCGEIRAIIGPNGAGKTTLLNAICGMVRTQAGSIKVDGKEVRGLSPSGIAENGIQRTFQTTKLFRHMTVLENVMTGLHLKLKGNVLSPSFWLGEGLVEEREAGRLSREALSYTGAEHLADRSASTLAFGEQRLVEIARALVAVPKLILLDEPAVGLNSSQIDNLSALLRRIQKERGITVVLVEHVMGLVVSVSDRVTVMSAGRVITEGTPADVVQDPAVVEAYLGSSYQTAKRD